MLKEKLFGVRVSFFDDLADGFVDLKGHLGGKIPLGIRIVAPEEDRSGIALILDWAELAHTEFRNHQTSEPGGFGNVVRSARRNVLEEDLFGGAAAQKARDSGDQFVLGHQEAVVFRGHEHVPTGVAARDDRDLLHLIAIRQVDADDGVARFMVSNLLALFLRHAFRRFGRARDAAIDSLINIRKGDCTLVPADSQDRSVVQNGINIRAGEADGTLGKRIEVNARIDALSSGVDTENRFTPRPVWQRNGDGAVKSTSTAKRGVEDVVTVGRGDDEDAGIGLETIHFDEQLVQGLLAFVVAAA